MLIRSLRLTNFTVYEFEEIKLPKTGIVLVTGENGAGKSSLIEAVAYGGWGKSIRGTAPFRLEEGLKVELTTDTVEIQRSRYKKLHQLVFTDLSTGQSIRYETNTKAQESLETIIGDFAIWRRTHVFSSHDALYFSLATDGERKQLLESLLGLECFDHALEACRVDSKQRLIARNDFSLLHEKLRARCEDITTRYNQFCMGLSNFALNNEKVHVCSEYENFSILREEVTKELEILELERASLSKEIGCYDGDLMALRRQLAVLNQEVCSSCQQPISKEKRNEVAERLEYLRLVQKRNQDFLSKRLSELSLFIQDIKEQKSYFERGMLEYSEQLRQAELFESQYSLLKSQCEDLRGELGRVRLEADNAHKDWLAACIEYETLSAVELVLGLRGVRATLLSEAIKSLEALANRWLYKLSDGKLSVMLEATTERRGGTTVDVISLKTLGIGECLDYKAASSGQRRRIDVSLLMGLAEMGSAAHGSVSGTLFFDEVFDALDTRGTQLACEALHELAQTRAVVVISHSEVLQEMLRPAQHLHVHQGRIEVW